MEEIINDDVQLKEFALLELFDGTGFLEKLLNKKRKGRFNH